MLNYLAVFFRLQELKQSSLYRFIFENDLKANDHVQITDINDVFMQTALQALWIVEIGSNKAYNQALNYVLSCVCVVKEGDRDCGSVVSGHDSALTPFLYPSPRPPRWQEMRHEAHSPDLGGCVLIPVG